MIRQLWVGDGFTLAVRLLFRQQRARHYGGEQEGRDRWARKR